VGLYSALSWTHTSHHSTSLARTCVTGCVYVETENLSIQSFTVTHNGHPALLRRFSRDLSAVILLTYLLSYLLKALRYGTRSEGISQFYLHTPRSSANGINHTCPCLSSRSWWRPSHEYYCSAWCFDVGMTSPLGLRAPPPPYAAGAFVGSGM